MRAHKEANMSETNMKKENIMGTLPIKELLVKMSVPVILSMLVSTLYNVVDSIFVSRLGESALTAMSLGTPVSSLIACVTVGFSVGMNAVLSKRLGKVVGSPYPFVIFHLVWSPVDAPYDNL